MNTGTALDFTRGRRHEHPRCSTFQQAPRFIGMVLASQTNDANARQRLHPHQRHANHINEVG